MISIERVLIKRFVLVAIGMVVVLAMLHHWWAEQFFIKLQKQQLQQERIALEHHFKEDGISLSTAFEQVLPKHSNHFYYVQQGDQRWSSSADFERRFPLQHWLQQDGIYNFQADERSYLALSLLSTSGARFIVVQETTQSRAELEQSHLYMLLAVAIALSMLLYLQHRVIRTVFSRLDNISGEINALQRGEIPQLQPAEIKEISPMVCAINRLLGYLDNRVQRSKNAVGDLSHAMKTPLAVIRQIAERQDCPLPPRTRDQLLAQAEQLDSILSCELKRARITGRSSRAERFSMQQTLADLSATLQLIYPTKTLAFDLDIDHAAYFPGDRSDFTEMMGNLLDNASKWCQRSIDVRIEQRNNRLEIEVQDDGPGCDDAQIEQLLLRGQRLDERAEGHGLGLNIVNSIVKQYEGDIRISNSPSGGLCILLMLPLF